MNEAKEHILTTALGLFLQKNFKEVTMKEIVDGSGLSKGAFYHYFGSKEQVFQEAADHFLPELLALDYKGCSKANLKQFYADVFEEIGIKAELLNQRLKAVAPDSAGSNIYYFLLDAAKMLPDFAGKHQHQRKGDLKAWKNIISTAILTNEIKTPLNEEQVARLFISLADGINFNVNLGADRNELKAAWDYLYRTMKE